MKTQSYPNLRPVMLAASLAAVFYLASTPFSSTRSSAEPEVRPRVVVPAKEEYKIVVIASPSVEELQMELNKQADDGWKLRTAMDKMMIFAK